MKEFETYDKAVAEYLRRHPLLCAPLVSWDFFSEAADASEALRDLNSLLQFASLHRWIIDEEVKALLSPRTVIVVTDPDIKIVFATQNIIDMNGFTAEEVIGRSPKSFQGKETDPAVNIRIRQAIDEKTPFEETLVNYLKDGTTYACHIKGFPVFDTEGNLAHFIAFENAA